MDAAYDDPNALQEPDNTVHEWRHLKGYAGGRFRAQRVTKAQVDQIWNPDDLGICREDVRQKNRVRM